MIETGKERPASSGVWVVVENDLNNHAPKKVTYELLSEARVLADQLNEEVTAVNLCETIDANMPQVLQKLGCDRLLSVTNQLLRGYHSELYADIVADLAQKEHPSIILVPGTENGRDFAPRISAKLKVGLTADCTGLAINEKRELVQIRPTYGGNLMAYITTPCHRPQMATIRPNVFTVRECPNRRPLKKEQIPVTIDESILRYRHIETEPRESACRDVSEAEIILVGGYGLGKENFPLLYRLASQINAAVGATRKAVDEGWAPYEIQIGQTGKNVAPELCILFGVSGALQHTIGIRNAKKVIAVNNDPTAPIFKQSDTAILADAAEVIKLLLQKADEIKNTRRDLVWH